MQEEAQVCEGHLLVGVQTWLSIFSVHVCLHVRGHKFTTCLSALLCAYRNIPTFIPSRAMLDTETVRARF